MILEHLEHLEHLEQITSKFSIFFLDLICLLHCSIRCFLYKYLYSNISKSNHVINRQQTQQKIKQERSRCEGRWNDDMRGIWIYNMQVEVEKLFGTLLPKTEGSLIIITEGCC